MAVLQSFNIALEKEGKKKLSQHGVFVVGHPAKYYPRRTGLNFVERTDHVAVFVGLRWAFLFFAKMRKSIKKRKNLWYRTAGKVVRDKKLEECEKENYYFLW